MAWTKYALTAVGHGLLPGSDAHLVVRADDESEAIMLLRDLYIWLKGPEHKDSIIPGEDVSALAVALGWSGHEDEIAGAFDARFVFPLHLEKQGFWNERGDGAFAEANRADERVFVVGRPFEPRPPPDVKVLSDRICYCRNAQSLPPWKVRFAQKGTVVGGQVTGESLVGVTVNGQQMPAAQFGGGFVLPQLGAPEPGGSHILECALSSHSGLVTVTWFLAPTAEAL